MSLPRRPSRPWPHTAPRRHDYSARSNACSTPAPEYLHICPAPYATQHPVSDRSRSRYLGAPAKCLLSWTSCFVWSTSVRTYTPICSENQRQDSLASWTALTRSAWRPRPRWSLRKSYPRTLHPGDDHRTLWIASLERVISTYGVVSSLTRRKYPVTYNVYTLTHG